MPRIGRILASPDVPNPARPALVESGIAGAPYKAAAQGFGIVPKAIEDVAETVFKMDERRQKIERSNKVLELATSAKLATARLEDDLRQAPDPDRHYDKLWKGLRQIEEAHLDAIGDDEEARLAFLQSWAPHKEQKLAAGMFDQFKMKVGRDKGDLLTALDLKVKEAVDKPVAEIEGFATTLEQQIEGARALFTDPEDVAKWKLDWRKKVYQEHAAHQMRKNPIKFLDIYDEGGGPYKGKVDQSALDKIAEQAIAQIKRLDAARDRESKKNSDEVRKFIESEAYDKRIDIAPLIRQYESALDATDLTHLRSVNEVLMDKRERKLTESKPGKRVELLSKIELGEITDTRKFLAAAKDNLSEEHTIEGLRMLRSDRLTAKSDAEKEFNDNYEAAIEHLKTVFAPQATLLDPDNLGKQILGEALLTFRQGKAAMRESKTDPRSAVGEFVTRFTPIASFKALYGTNEFESMFARDTHLQNLVKNDDFDGARRHVLEKFKKSAPTDADYGTKEMYLRMIERQRAWRQQNPPKAPPKPTKSFWDRLLPRGIPGEND